MKKAYVIWILFFRTQLQKEHAAIDMQNALEKVGTEVMVGTSGGR